MRGEESVATGISVDHGVAEGLTVALIVYKRGEGEISNESPVCAGCGEERPIVSHTFKITVDLCEDDNSKEKAFEALRTFLTENPNPWEETNVG